MFFLQALGSIWPKWSVKTYLKAIACSDGISVGVSSRVHNIEIFGASVPTYFRLEKYIIF